MEGLQGDPGRGTGVAGQPSLALTATPEHPELSYDQDTDVLGDQHRDNGCTKLNCMGVLALGQPQPPGSSPVWTASLSVTLGPLSPGVP